MKEDQHLQKEIIYIYHVTRENSVNLIPLFHLKNKADIKITSLAIYNDEINKQLEYLQLVLKDKHIPHKRAIECKFYNETEVKQIIKDNCLDEYDVIINIGGGQKSHTLFLHELYYTLHISGCEPTLIYPDMTRTSEIDDPVIRMWTGKKALGNPSKEKINLAEGSFSIKHLLKAYGVKALRDVFMHDDTKPIFYKYENHYKKPDFRKVVRNYYSDNIEQPNYGDFLDEFFKNRKIDLSTQNQWQLIRSLLVKDRNLKVEENEKPYEMLEKFFDLKNFDPYKNLWQNTIVILNNCKEIDSKLISHFKKQMKVQKFKKSIHIKSLPCDEDLANSVEECQKVFCSVSNNKNKYLVANDRIINDYPAGFVYARNSRCTNIDGVEKIVKDFTPGNYFEIIIQKMVGDHLEKIKREKPTSENIIDEQYNLHLFDLKTKRNLAELDVILMSNKGRLLAIDAKGGSGFEVKDYQSRLYIQKQSFGTFIEFTAILYCPHSDHKGSKVNPYLKMAYSYAKNDIDFYIYDPEATSIEQRYLWKDDKQYIFDRGEKAGNHKKFKISNQHDLFIRINAL